MNDKNHQIDWKLIGQWITIVAILFGSWIAQDRRITTVEAAMNEQMKGYVLILHTLNDRLDRLENKIDRIMSENRRRND